MEAVLPVLNVLLPVLYGGLVVAYAVLFLRDAPWARRLAPRLLDATVALHLLFTLGLGLRLGRHPMGTVFEVFSFVALAVAASYLWVERRRRNPYTGAFPLSFAFLLQVCASLALLDGGPLPERLDDPLFAWHTGAMALALTALTVGAVYGVLFLALYRALKAGRLGRFSRRVPSLDTLAQMALHAEELGFVALTAGLGLGMLWTHRASGAAVLDAKVLGTLVVWAVYGVALAGRALARWGGWRVVTVSLAGYGVLLASILTVGRLFPTFHRFAG